MNDTFRMVTGVNTGFGGSADTRTDKTVELQDSLIDFLNCGVIVNGGAAHSDASSATTIPEAWVRASMLVRANSLARGHSGVRSAVIGGLVDFLNHDIVPTIPLRGSISASGDLIPLSYIAGALQGKSGINVWANIRSEHLSSQQDGTKCIKGHITPPTPTDLDRGSALKLLDDGHSSGLPTLNTTWPTPPNKAFINTPIQHLRQSIEARDALIHHSLTPLKLEPKEGLSLVNGTAVSAGTGALAVHDAQSIALLAQILTAMSVEAFTGTTESFEPSIAYARPHPGQVEVAHNIRCFLKGSRLAVNNENEGLRDQGGLRQDRYSLRTTPQWIGPQLENLMLAYQQVEIECNSTTDNPILDTMNGRVLHGGNFQALAITSAMEKIRQSIQQIGRMLFVQCSELVDPVFNNGLPPNLEAGEPSQGFLMKGVDINVASLCSELGYLANPITPHVQTAEMGNQSLNSMAFVSARYTHTALDVISQLAAAHVFVVCQALDLRCIQRIFYESLEPRLNAITHTILDKHIKACSLPELQKRIWSRCRSEFNRTTSQDSTGRFDNIFKSLQPEILSMPDLENTATLFASLAQWTSYAAGEASSLRRDCIAGYISQPSAKKFLGSASFRIWDFVRHELKVPFHIGKGGFWNIFHKDEDVSVGEMVTRIYVAIKEGGLVGVAMECVREAHVTLEKK